MKTTTSDRSLWIELTEDWAETLNGGGSYGYDDKKDDRKKDYCYYPKKDYGYYPKHDYCYYPKKKDYC